MFDSGYGKQTSLLPNQDKFFASVDSAAQARRARDIERILNEELPKFARNVGTDATLILETYAPIRSGRLKHGIRATPIGPQVVVSATAVDPRSGYDYVAVTRFGHRKRFIVPVTKSGKARKSRTVKRNVAGQFTARGEASLMFTSRDRIWMLPRVRGFRPRGDWVDRAWPEIKDAADGEMQKMGHEIEVVWSA